MENFIMMEKRIYGLLKKMSHVKNLCPILYINILYIK